MMPEDAVSYADSGSRVGMSPADWMTYVSAGVAARAAPANSRELRTSSFFISLFLLWMNPDVTGQ